MWSCVRTWSSGPVDNGTSSHPERRTAGCHRLQASRDYQPSTPEQNGRQQVDTEPTFLLSAGHHSDLSLDNNNYLKFKPEMCVSALLDNNCWLPVCSYFFHSHTSRWNMAIFFTITCSSRDAVA